MASPLTEANLADPVTAHMHQDFTSLRLGQSVGAALDWMRQNRPAGRIIYFYVVDEEGRLCGVVPTRRLLLNAPDRPLAEIMVPKVVSLPAAATVLDACEFFILHRLLAFPVVDPEGRLLGVVDMQLYTDELTELHKAARRDDLFQLVGVHLAEVQQNNPVAAFRSRFPWLGCNLAAGILVAFLSGAFEGVLNKVVALTFFIPVVLTLAESVSTQSVSLALQLLHGTPPTWGTLWPRLRGELLTGLLLGMGGGLVIGLVALVWLGQPNVALCVLAGIGGGAAAAAGLGIALPVGLRLLHLDPQVAAGPIALAGTDVVTMLLYLNLAGWLLG
jgi:magnesium transporter